MGKAKYVKPGLSVDLVTGLETFLNMSDNIISDDPATEPAMVREWFDTWDDNETTSTSDFAGEEL